jgi:hypothetical protein
MFDPALLESSLDAPCAQLRAGELATIAAKLLE